MRHRVTGPALALVLLVAAWACRTTGEQAEPDAAALRATDLYRTHCAVCHGERGAGDGPAYPWLAPPPRDFTSTRFRLVSTANGAPTRDDLVRTLRRGMPGSAMPSFAWMPGRDLELLADHVRELAVVGAAERLRQVARAEGSSVRMRSARLDAEELMRPGPVLAPARELAASDAALARGRELYVEHCAGCHASDGSGDPAPRLDEDGRLNWARDFTAGFLKGGARAEDLSWRIQAGIPGTAMPPFQLESQADLQALVACVQELIPPGSDMRMVHDRRRVRVARVDVLPTEPDDPAWAGAGEVDIVLSPLRWSDRAILGAELAAFHDGRRIAVRLRWNDPSVEQDLFTDLTHPDACALQLSVAESPPLFGMGTRAHPTNLWHWKALQISQVAGLLDSTTRPPHAVGEPFRGSSLPDAPVYHREVSLPPAASGAVSLRAEGVDAPALPTTSRPVVGAVPRWFDGTWEVVFTRDLASARVGEVQLAPGRTAQVAVAVWNGAAGDARGQKSISIWHALELEP